ncbi:hypothetical protein B566_EDAN006831 [Ephemera danica]|nr:hypothetical protein B566_EDAN006831 [Ephemera danica]
MKTLKTPHLSAENSSDSEFENDLAEVTGKKTKRSKGAGDSESDAMSDSEDEQDLGSCSEDSESEDGSIQSDAESEDTHSDMKPKKKKVRFEMNEPNTVKESVNKAEAMDSEEESLNAFDDDTMDASDNEDGEEVDEDSAENSDKEQEEEMKESNPKIWEDIYGRKRDKQGNVVKENTGRYIPPALRAKSASDSAKLLRLKRQMQGLLNRVAESNMGSVASQLEGVMATHSRGDASEVLGQLILAAVAPSHSVTPTKMAAEHALLLALLHAHIGNEIGATFLQTIVKALDENYNEELEVENKVLNNLLLTLCFLYSFKIFHCSLMFDLLKKFSKRFEEKDVELILLVLKSIGPCLRKDDPITLKDLILQLQKQASFSPKLQESSRVRFMLDILLAIKNNNMSRIPDYNPDLVDHMRKVLRGLLRHVEERGRWWVVGSAWQGAGPGTTDPETKVPNVSQNLSQKLLDLARKQRMNTDVRKNIFCILMAAEDFLDAFEKLLHLGLKGPQEREISYVLLDCCLQEQEFNPYYFHLAQKFCDFDRKFKMSIQCSIWDKLKDLSKLTASQLHNIAFFTFNLILNNGLNVSVLKVIEFADLNKWSIKFLRKVLLGLLLCTDDNACREAFSRIPNSQQFSLFRESLNVFLHKYIIRNQKNIPNDTNFDLLASRVNLVQQILANADAKIAM